MKKRFFASILALCMVMSLLPVTAFAEEGSDSNDADVSVSTSLPNADNSGKITLTSDVKATLTINQGETRTLDLAGFTLTNSDGQHTIVNYGQLTITDSSEGKTGTVDNVSNERAALYNYPGGVVTLNGGTFDRSYEASVGKESGQTGGNSFYTIKNFGTMTVYAGVTVQQDGTENSGTTGKYSSLFANGWQNGSTAGQNGREPAVQNGGATLTIYGGIFKGGLNTIKNDDYGQLTIYDGTFSNYYQAVVQNHNEAVIYGGTYTAASDSAYTTFGIYNCGCAPELDKGNLTVAGGTFTGATYGIYEVSTEKAVVNICGDVSINGTTAAVATSSGSQANISITGGAFSSNVSAYVADGYKSTSSDGTFAVAPKTNPGNNDVAVVNGQYFETLAAAIAAAEGGTVQLLNNVTMTASTDITTSLTLDLNGYTVTGLSNAYSLRIYGSGVEVTIKDSSENATGKIISGRNDSGGIIQVADAAKLTLESGTVEATGNNGGCPVLVIGKGAGIGENKEGATFIMNGGALLADGYYALAGNGTWDGTNITISGGTISSKSSGAIYHPQEGTLVLNGGEITGTTGVQICGGELQIPENSTVVITATGEDEREGKTGDGLIDDGAAISVVSRGGGYGAVKATIAAGSFASQHSEAVLSYAWSSNTVDENGNSLDEFISGGNFSSSVQKEYLVSSLTTELYSTQRNSEAPYSYYTSVAEAVKATAGDTNAVISLVGVGEDEQITVTLDPNGGKTSVATMVVEKDAEIILPTATRPGYTFLGWTDGNGKFYRAGDTVTVTADTTLTAQWHKNATPAPSYSITTPKADNGTVTVSPASAKKDAQVTITVTPDEGYQLDKLTVTDANGKAIPLTDKGDGKYTFTMPASKVTVKATFEEIPQIHVCPAEKFTDVNPSLWYHEAVDYVIEAGMMNGTGANKFEPNGTTTRGMIVTILYRLEGEPAVTGASSFTDVESGTWYTNPIAWAAANQVVNGTSATTFAPNAPITREQMAAILYRYAALKGYDVAQKADLSGYTDAGQISDYAKDAMAWANAKGLITGETATTLAPQGNATRAEVATILMRFCETVAK